MSPTFTVRLAGANAKFVMLTAVPATGAAGAVDDVAAGIGPMPGMPRDQWEAMRPPLDRAGSIAVQVWKFCDGWKPAGL